MPLTRIAALWRNLVRRSRSDRELRDELDAYVDLLAAEKVAAGVPPDRARRAALVETGGVQQVVEEVRDVRAGARLEQLTRDVRLAARGLAARPGFTAAAALALALGVGANTAVFSVADAVLLRPLPYAHPDRLVTLLHGASNPVAPGNLFAWRRDTRAFEGIGAAQYWEPNLTGRDRPERLTALRVTPDLFPLLGVPPLFGRAFLNEEGVAGAGEVAIIGHSLWQRRFGGDSSIVGQTIALDGHTYTVVGVMPPSFRFAPFWETKAELWAPLALEVNADPRQGGQSLRLFARLKTGVTLAQARADVGAVTARLEREFPGTNRDVAVTPLEEQVVGDVRPALLVLAGAVAFVLLIACANVAHMLLARAASRRREIAVRRALGATRGRLVQQLLVESVLLSALGGALALPLAFGSVRALVAYASESLPRMEAVGLDVRAVVFLSLVSVLTGIVFGLVPALQTSGGVGVEAMREGARGASEGRRGRQMRGLLVASQLAVALVLLVGAGLMVRSFAALLDIDPGFDPTNVSTMVVSVDGTKEAEPARRAAFFREALERVRAVPGVRSASAINHLPLAGDEWGWRFHVEGRAAAADAELPRATYRVVLPGYHETMRIPLLEGRTIDETDVMSARPVVVINEWMARRHWPGEDPIGKRVTNDDPGDSSAVWYTVVGVVKDDARAAWAEEPGEEVFLPFLQSHAYLEGAGSGTRYLSFVVRTERDPSAMVPSLREAVWSIDRDVTIAEVQTMAHVVSEANARPRFYLLLLTVFAAVALVLAALGVYGVMSHAVSRRTREIGIRVALGATRGHALGLVVGQTMGIAAAGVGVGVLGAFALTRLMAAFLYGVRPTDPVTFVVAPVVLLVAALAASLVPARRATRVDPVTALRAE